MSLFELVLLAIGVSMDAFAVSICKGLCTKRLDFSLMLKLGIAFGGFQALMPLIGYFLGNSMMWLIAPIDHWIAFILLAIIGGNMIREAISDKDDETVACSIEGTKISLSELLLLAIATSIDALAVGISLAALQVHIYSSVALIGITTCAFSMAGVAIGSKFGSLWEKKASIAGGIILILIGTKVLLTHLGFINF